MVGKRILRFCILCLITSSSDAAVKGADSRGRRQQSLCWPGQICVCIVLVGDSTRGIQANEKGLESAAVIA